MPSVMIVGMPLSRLCSVRANCETSTCATNYRILRAEHDLCDEDTLSQNAETGIHDYEKICEDFNCNVLTDESLIEAQLICREEDQTVKDDGSAAAATTATGFTLLMLVAPMFKEIVN